MAPGIRWYLQKIDKESIKDMPTEELGLLLFRIFQTERIPEQYKSLNPQARNAWRKKALELRGQLKNILVEECSEDSHGQSNPPAN